MTIRTDARGTRVRQPPIQIGKLFDREPPNAPEAEMALLGAIILSPKVLPEVMAIIPDSAAFFGEAHATIYRALTITYGSARGGDLATLAAELRAQGQFDAIGGGDYLSKLAGETPGPASAPHYAKIVAGQHRLRELIRVCGESLHEAYTCASTDPSAIDAVVTGGMEKVSSVQARSSEFFDISVKDAEDEVLDDIENHSKPSAMLKTGIEPIDEQFGGIPRVGVMGILAAPSVGKSTLMLQMLQNIGLGMDGQEPVASRIFSYEQPPKRVAATMWTQRSGVQMHAAMNNRGAGLSPEEWTNALSARTNHPSVRICRIALNGAEIFNRARVYREQGVGIVAVDYLQLLRPIPGYESGEERQGENIRWLQRIGVELEMLVILIGQIDKEAARTVRGNDERPPVASDYKGSSAYEQLIDVSWGLHRPHRHLPKPLIGPGGDFAAYAEIESWRQKVNETTLGVDKAKYGPLGRVSLRFCPQSMTFV